MRILYNKQAELDKHKFVEQVVRKLFRGNRRDHSNSDPEHRQGVFRQYMEQVVRKKLAQS